MAQWIIKKKIQSIAKHDYVSSIQLTFRVFNNCWIFPDTFPCAYTTTYMQLQHTGYILDILKQQSIKYYLYNNNQLIIP